MRVKTRAVIWINRQSPDRRRAAPARAHRTVAAGRPGQRQRVRDRRAQARGRRGNRTKGRSSPTPVRFGDRRLCLHPRARADLPRRDPRDTAPQGGPSDRPTRRRARHRAPTDPRPDRKGCRLGLAREPKMARAPTARRSRTRHGAQERERQPPHRPIHSVQRAAGDPSLAVRPPVSPRSC